MKKTKPQVTVRISEEARKKLKILSAKAGMSFTDYVDLIAK